MRLSQLEHFCRREWTESRESAHAEMTDVSKKKGNWQVMKERKFPHIESPPCSFFMFDGLEESAVGNCGWDCRTSLTIYVLSPAYFSSLSLSLCRSVFWFFILIEWIFSFFILLDYRLSVSITPSHHSAWRTGRELENPVQSQNVSDFPSSIKNLRVRAVFPPVFLFDLTRKGRDERKKRISYSSLEFCSVFILFNSRLKFYSSSIFLFCRLLVHSLLFSPTILSIPLFGAKWRCYSQVSFFPILLSHKIFLFSLLSSERHPKRGETADVK